MTAHAPRRHGVLCCVPSMCPARERLSPSQRRWTVVRTTREAIGAIGPGSVRWGGSAYFPEYIVDPKERLVILFMTQLRPSGGSNFNHLIKRLTYQALIK